MKKLLIVFCTVFTLFSELVLLILFISLFFYSCNNKKKGSNTVNTFAAPGSDTTTSVLKTRVGVLLEGMTLDETEKIMQATHLRIARVPVFFGLSATSNQVDKLLQDSFRVQINFNYMPTSTPVPYPTDTNLIASRTEEFCKHYAPYAKRIPFIAVENEYDNSTSVLGSDAYHNNGINYYITELKIITRIAHQYGFRVADAGITSTALSRWTYTQLSGQQQSDWLSKHFVGRSSSNFVPLMSLLSNYINSIRDINIDFLNVHWYNINVAHGDFKIATSAYLAACNKDRWVTNEFGIRILSDTVNKYDFWSNTVDEIRAAQPRFAIAYSGTDQPGKASSLDSIMLNRLKN